MSLPGLEIVYFEYPRKRENTLWVSNIPSELSFLEVESILENIGPITHLKLFPIHAQKKGISKGYEMRETRAARVQYLVTHDAVRAQAILQGQKFLGTKIKLHQDRICFNKNGLFRKGPIPLSKAFQVANHFLGYDGWDSRILKVEFL
eukprot:Sdes_comp20705_c0_seq5m16348